MNEFDQNILRIKYALQSLSHTHQIELAIFIEHYASEYGTYDNTNFQHIDIEVDDVKKIN